MELSNLDKLRQAVEFINGLTGKKLETSGMDVRQGLAVKCLHWMTCNKAFYGTNDESEIIVRIRTGKPKTANNLEHRMDT